MTVTKEDLLLDMDGCIADFNKFSIQTYNRVVPGANLDENDIDRYLGDHEVIDPTIDKKILRRPYKEPGSFVNLPVIPGAQEAVARLEKHFNIYLLTTQYYGNPTCVHEKHVWLQRYFPSIADNGIFTKHKPMVKGAIFVDDRPTNLAAWKAKNPEGKTASLQYKWSDPKVTDILAPTWEELATKIIGAFNGKER